MTEIVLVRHGQANSTATDEADYDRLSDLGRTQAEWLGAHFAATDPHFDQVITGTLLRQRETARAMGYATDKQDARLNELTYFELAKAMEVEHGIPAPTDPTQFARHLPEVIAHWADDRLETVPERFTDFSARVCGLVDELCHARGRILVVTSGGVIGMTLRHVMGLDTSGMAQVMLQTRNSSVHRLHYVHDQLMLAGFNATPHLDEPGRAHARTYV